MSHVDWGVGSHTSHKSSSTQHTHTHTHKQILRLKNTDIPILGHYE